MTKRPLLEILSWIAGIISALLAVFIWAKSDSEPTRAGVPPPIAAAVGNGGSEPARHAGVPPPIAAAAENGTSPRDVSTETLPRILWKEKIGVASWRNNPLFVGQYLYIGSSGTNWNSPDLLDGICAFDARTGRRLWFVPSVIDVNDLAYIEGLIIGGNDLGDVLAVSAISGELLWKVRVDGAVYARPTYSDSGIVIGTGTGNLYLLDLQSGKVLDKTKVDGGIRAGLTARDAYVYVATEEGWLYEFTTFNRFNLRKKTELTYPVYAAPLLTEDKLIIGFVRDTYYSYPAVAAMRLSGKGKGGEDYLWSGTDPLKKVDDDFGNIRFTPGRFNNTIIFGNPYSNSVYAINERDGKVTWSTNLGQSMFQHWSSPLVADGSVYVARHDGLVHKLNPVNGERIWSVFLGYSKSAGLTFSKNSRLPGENHQTQWNPLASRPIFSTPAYSDGLLAVATGEGFLYVLDTLAR